MTEHDYTATVEVGGKTFTFSGDDPRVVSAQAARIPVKMHAGQVRERIDVDTPVHKYLEKIAHEEEQRRKNAKPDHLD